MSQSCCIFDAVLSKRAGELGKRNEKRISCLSRQDIRKGRVRVADDFDYPIISAIFFVT